MAVHMLRVVTSSGGMTLAEINDAMDTWVANHSEWAEDAAEHHIVEANTFGEGAGTDYYTGDFRFHLEDAKDNLLQKCGDKLRNKVEWYRLGYHQCDHDEADTLGCSWDDEREWTATDATIPTAVPDFL